MESHHVPVAIRLLVSVCLIAGYCYGQCRFEYRKQPPSTVQHCNPYRVNIVKISLECVVRRQTGITDEFEIMWFRENATGGVDNLGLGEPDVQQGENDWLSRYHNAKLFNQQYNPSFAGKYWCQVINTTADPDQPLMKSNVFTLLPPDNYAGGTTCTEMLSIQQIDNIKCADLPVASDHNTQPAHLSTKISTDKDTLKTSDMLVPPLTTTFIVTSVSNTLTITNTPATPPTTEIVSGVILPLLLLLLVCSTFIMILIVMKRRRKKIDKQNHLADKDIITCVGGYDMQGSITQQSSETTDKAKISADKQPVAYEIPVIARKEKNHKPDAHYSIVREANMSNTDNDRDNKHVVHCSIATPTLDNPIYLSELVHTSEPDHQYSSLNHQLIPLTHEYGGTGSGGDSPVPVSAGMVDSSHHYSSLNHQMLPTHQNDLNNPMYSLGSDGGDNNTEDHQHYTSEHTQVPSTHKHADSSNSPGTLGNPIYLLEPNEELNNSTGGEYSSLHHQVLTTQSSDGSTGAADGLYSKLNAH